jgi:CBS domain-containing protein
MGKASTTKGAAMGKNVRDVMETRPRAVTPDTSVHEVAQLMASEDVGAIPVIDGDRLAGMVTDRDIVVRAIAQGKDPRGMPVSEVASGELLVVHPDEDLGDALMLMARGQVRRLPVVDEGDRLVGIVSQADVAREAKEKDVAKMLEVISEPARGPRLNG